MTTLPTRRLEPDTACILHWVFRRGSDTLTCAIEAGDRLIQEIPRGGGSDRTVEELWPDLLDARPKLDASVSDNASPLGDVRKQVHRRRVVTETLQRLAQTALQLHPDGIGGGEKRNGARQQPVSGTMVEAEQCPPASTAKT